MKIGVSRYISMKLSFGSPSYNSFSHRSYLLAYTRLPIQHPIS